jgi:hypothetical protein
MALPPTSGPLPLRFGAPPCCVKGCFRLAKSQGRKEAPRYANSAVMQELFGLSSTTPTPLCSWHWQHLALFAENAPRACRSVYTQRRTVLVCGSAFPRSSLPPRAEYVCTRFLRTALRPIGRVSSFEGGPASCFHKCHAWCASALGSRNKLACIYEHNSGCCAFPGNVALLPDIMDLPLDDPFGGEAPFEMVQPTTWDLPHASTSFKGVDIESR